MAAPKRRLLICIVVTLLVLFLNVVSSEETLTNYDDHYERTDNSDNDDSILKIKHQHLLSYILNLESSIDERSRDISSKDERIKQLETIVLEKSKSLSSLHSEIQSLQEKESSDVKEQEGEVLERFGELVKQVENLKDEIAMQKAKKDALETRINTAETKIAELNLKLEKLQRINEEQKIRIRNTEDALRTVEEERIRVQLKAAQHSKELEEVHNSWLPPWLAVHLFQCQTFMVNNWNVYGRPALDAAVQKALETNVQVQNWGRLYIDELQTKWIPTVKEQWLTFVTNTEPNMQVLTANTVEFYHESKKALMPHVIKIQHVLDPYIKEANKFTKPYTNQLTKTLKPHINKAHIFLKPYTKKVLRGYRRVSKTILKNHRQARANIHAMLNSNEFTRPFASYELEWFMASAFMVFPVMVVLSRVSSLFSKKSRRRTRSSHTNHSRRRAKRRVPEKSTTAT
ncbi:uncharacterized protein [Rutidosis leptorrhynchoides]|uniref:uncharacterized protein n=1 Tax=Rutidosis leptorrhynchoides TaxID=125765 RepID=UPI003A99D158